MLKTAVKASAVLSGLNSNKKTQYKIRARKVPSMAFNFTKAFSA